MLLSSLLPAPESLCVVQLLPSQYDNHILPEEVIIGNNLAVFVLERVCLASGILEADSFIKQRLEPVATLWQDGISPHQKSTLKIHNQSM